MTAHGFEQVVFCHDAASGLRSIIAIHDTALGPALGGGKSVIIGDPARDKTAPLLRAHGWFIQTLGGRYIPAPPPISPRTGCAQRETCGMRPPGSPGGMATQKQRAAAKRNVEKAQAGAKRKQTLKNMPRKTRTALGVEANKVRRGEEPTRKELEAQARKLNIRGRSKMGKAELKRAVRRAGG